MTLGNKETPLAKEYRKLTPEHISPCETSFQRKTNQTEPQTLPNSPDLTSNTPLMYRPQNIHNGFQTDT